MWVKNQDKITVAKVSALSIDYRDLIASQSKNKEERPKFYRVWGQVAEHDYVMGTYKSFNKAKEVINDFFSAINKCYLLYEMPEDDSEPDTDMTEVA